MVVVEFWNGLLFDRPDGLLFDGPAAVLVLAVGSSVEPQHLGSDEVLVVF